MQSVTIGPNQAGQRFDKFLHKYLPQAQTSFLYKMLRKKNITLNGKKAEGKEILQLGDEVKLFFSEETFTKFAGDVSSVTETTSQQSASMKNPQSSKALPEANKALRQYYDAYGKFKGITVIYEDEHALILNKPAGILTQKAQGADLSLNEWMIGYLLHTNGITPQELRSFKPSVCNRLDRNTSGLVLCGKSLPGSQALSRLIHDRSVRKFYRTITGGMITAQERIEGYLVKDKKTNKVKIYEKASKDSDAEPICTAYQPLAAIRKPAQIPQGLTCLEVELITGKTHQIRAHLSSTGHPLIGDHKYGNKAINDYFSRRHNLTNQLLHAYRLEFPDMTGALSGLSGRNIVAPLPHYFETLVKEYFGSFEESAM